MDALKTTNQEVVHEGWLTKSPPPKLWKARWRQRWFTLRHGGELPGQYFLEYYTDKRCRKLKGRIDLDECEQVDAGLSFENRKEKYQYMFSVRTPKRIYYLVSENEADLNKWVDAICQVCGLKAYTQDEEQQCEIFPYESQDSPPLSPTSIISGPYIPISECFTGPSLNDTSSLSSAITESNNNYDTGRRCMPSPPRSPTTDAESIVTDEEWAPTLPNVNWDTFPSAGELKPGYRKRNTRIKSWSVQKSFGKLKTQDLKQGSAKNQVPIPPRPPKPSHMISDSPGHNYLNLDGATESSKPTTPSTPARSILPKDLNSSGNPLRSGKNMQSKLNTTNESEISHSARSKDRVFSYDAENDNHPDLESASASYSNLSTKDDVPEIIVPPASPPLVYRELKPGRKISETSQCSDFSHNTIIKDASSTENSIAEPPSINRELKPLLPKPQVRGKGKKNKPIISPVVRPNTYRNRQFSISDDDTTAFGEKDEIFLYQDSEALLPSPNQRLLVLQYLDLDLETSESLTNQVLQQQQSPMTTVYKTVDFVKTEAFNRTRQKVEEERKQCTDELI
ncbi:hypothetical protein QAD02_010551 [Eretmocerus hayati]|uniref:Uncharacterized protein n=1 Tax=Eretmocerus hayati TaxID=131215 RepID=A0ACC2NUA8_9HYME|nr:hypothetical protein QAD02_010551 [Eretmocerus hayati]